MAGAPWLLADDTARLFNAMIAALSSNVYARPIVFTPMEGKYAGNPCNGVMLHVAAPSSFLPVATGWLLVKIIKTLHPANFQWAPYPTHVNPTGTKHLDLLSGISDTEMLFETALPDFINVVKQQVMPSDWPIRIQPYLMYT